MAQFVRLAKNVKKSQSEVGFMKIRGFVIGYVIILAGLSMGAAGFCYVMNCRDWLPETYAICGGVLGFVTLMYACFVISRIYTIYQQIADAGDIKNITECVGHVGRKRGVRCYLALGHYGIVFDAPSLGCFSILYEELRDYQAKSFEIMFSSNGVPYRLVFDKKLKAKVTSDYIEKQRALSV